MLDLKVRDYFSCPNPTGDFRQDLSTSIRRCSQEMGGREWEKGGGDQFPPRGDLQWCAGRLTNAPLGLCMVSMGSCPDVPLGCVKLGSLPSLDEEMISVANVSFLGMED